MPATSLMQDQAEAGPSFGATAQHGGAKRAWLRSVNVTNIAVVAALAVSVWGWFPAIRSPLWLDETVSYWQISGGFSQVWQRQWLSFPAYPYILWITDALFGSNPVVLRMPSVLAMLGAMYVLYLIAREFFAFDVAVIVSLVFCLHPIVAFAAIDVRPYAFAVLAVNCATLMLLRWMKTNSTRHAVLFGVATGAIVYFHYLFGFVVVAFVLILLIRKWREYRAFAPKLAFAAIPFFLMMLPVFPRLVYLFQTSQTHVVDGVPSGMQLWETLTPGNILFAFVEAALVAAGMRKIAVTKSAFPGVTSLLLAAVPLGIPYVVSVETPIHIFVVRYRLVAVPGVALCWGVLVSCLNWRFARALFAVGLVASAFVSTFNGIHLTLPEKNHKFSWKYALESVDAKALPDHAPVLICSDIIESNFLPMPADPKTSELFAPLSYYKVESPVIPLPKGLNAAAKEQVKRFLATAIPAGEDFFVVASGSSAGTVNWITATTADSYRMIPVGEFDHVAVVEYVSLSDKSSTTREAGVRQQSKTSHSTH